MKNACIFAVLVFLMGCKENPKTSKTEVLNATSIINKSIVVSGGAGFNNSEIAFDFRSIHYRAKYDGNKKKVSRFIFKENDTVQDVLNGENFQRYINKKPITLNDSIASKYAASVNAVHYFSVLPYGLNDKAVVKSMLGEETIKNIDYYKIKVTFNAIGGGEDFEDVFIYWINSETFKADYIAYSYAEAHGIGLRFRVAYHERYVNGLRFVDYNNYSAKNFETQLLDLGKAFEQKGLKLLSKIELKNIKVQLINN